MGFPSIALQVTEDGQASEGQGRNTLTATENQGESMGEALKKVVQLRSP